MSKVEKNVSWQEFAFSNPASIGARFEGSLWNIAGKSLYQKVFANNTASLYEMGSSGYIPANEEDKEGLSFHRKIEELGGRLLHQMVDDGSSIYVWENGLAFVSLTKSNYLTMQAVSEDKALITLLHNLCKEIILPAQRRGHIYAIVNSGMSLSLSSIGNASIPLEVGNYTQKVIDDYNFVVKDLQADSPTGRISIMEGEPGTGKTHLIRGLLHEVEDAMFVLVSPEMVPDLAGPQLLPLLMSHKHNYDYHGPIVLVLEDADRCLVTRGGDNIGSIQSLLNLGDGILGSLLDLRIIATTNAKKLEMETAILRPGRLSKRLEVGPLDSERAAKAFLRLCPEAKVPAKLLENKTITLAEVYSLARKAGWEPKVRDSDLPDDEEY